MNLNKLNWLKEYEWEIPMHGAMRVPGRLFGSVELIEEMDEKVYEQVCNVARLPGIVKASFAMPDAHWGYGFPIGGVAAFDADQGGVISAGGVGFDISCGVRNLTTGVRLANIRDVQDELASELFEHIPAGVGSTGALELTFNEMDDMLEGGAAWAVAEGYGTREDLERIEEHGRMAGADPDCVSEQAKRRQKQEMGTLGSGNHYLEVQHICEIFDAETARAFGIHEGEIILSIHCGSRGLGHQIGTDYLRKMVLEAPQHGIDLPDRELACVPINSELGSQYLGAMRAAMNCAMANRQILTHLVRQVFSDVIPQAHLSLLYDVSHNTCKYEEHVIDGVPRNLYVHRKGATRAFGPKNAALPASLFAIGQPVLIGGSMGTSSYILLGTQESMGMAFGSACHGAGRTMSRHQALKQYGGQQVVLELAAHGMSVRSPSMRGVAEEAPGAYKDVREVVEAAHRSGLARMVARLEPVITIKG